MTAEPIRVINSSRDVYGSFGCAQSAGDVIAAEKAKRFHDDVIGIPLATFLFGQLSSTEPPKCEFHDDFPYTLLPFSFPSETISRHAVKSKNRVRKLRSRLHRRETYNI